MSLKIEKINKTQLSSELVPEKFNWCDHHVIDLQDTTEYQTFVIRMGDKSLTICAMPGANCFDITAQSKIEGLVPEVIHFTKGRVESRADIPFDNEKPLEPQNIICVSYRQKDVE